MNLSRAPMHSVLLLCLVAAGVGISNLRADQLEKWHWRNPFPLANSLRSICSGANTFVAVGDGGIIHTSMDGINWDSGRRPVTRALRKVIFANGQFVAVGHGGVIVTSLDGHSWTNQTSNTTNALYSVAFGDGRLVACGEGGHLTVSTNGTDWLPGRVGTNDLNWITFGNGVFVVSASNLFPYQMAARVSSDGWDWTTHPFPEGSGIVYPHVLHEVAFGNGLFLAFADVEYHPDRITYDPRGQFFTSTDGTNWVAGAYAPGNKVHQFLEFADGFFHEAMGGLLRRTADGSSVDSQNLVTELEYATSMAYAEGQHVIAALEGRVWTSSDTIHWTTGHDGFRSKVHQIIRGANEFLTVADSMPLLASSDGLVFWALDTPTNVFGAVDFDGTNYVAVGMSANGLGGDPIGEVYTSTNSREWVRRTSNTTKRLAAVCRGATRWVSVGHDGTVITSPNTLAWTLRNSGTANTLSSVAFGNAVFVAVGNLGTIITSQDGSSWDVQFSGTTETLIRVRFLEGIFLAVGAKGTVLSSTDGINWHSRNSGTQRTLTDVTFGGGRYVACGYDNVILPLPDPINPNQLYWPSINVMLESTNGIAWKDITTKVPAHVGINSIAFLDGSFWLCGNNGAILQSDSVDGRPRVVGSMLPESAGFKVGIILNVPSSYRIQRRTGADTNSWQDVADITNAVPPFTWIDEDPASSLIQLYRVVSP